MTQKGHQKMLRIERIFFGNLRKTISCPPTPPIFVDRRRSAVDQNLLARRRHYEVGARLYNRETLDT